MTTPLESPRVMSPLEVPIVMGSGNPGGGSGGPGGVLVDLQKRMYKRKSVQCPSAFSKGSE